MLLQLAKVGKKKIHIHLVGQITKKKVKRYKRKEETSQNVKTESKGKNRGKETKNKRKKGSIKTHLFR